MTKKSTLLILSICLVFISGCVSSGNTTSITSTGLFFDREGTKPTDKFDARDIFYLVVSIDQPVSDSILRASWVAVETNRLAPNTVLKIDEVIPTSSPVVFKLQNEGNFWPTGQYKVYLYQDGKEFQVIDFEVFHDYFSE